jgi:hypothetical protein
MLLSSGQPDLKARLKLPPQRTSDTTFSRLVKQIATITQRSRWRVNAGLDDSNPFRMVGRFACGPAQ